MAQSTSRRHVACRAASGLERTYSCSKRKQGNRKTRVKKTSCSPRLQLCKGRPFPTFMSGSSTSRVLDRHNRRTSARKYSQVSAAKASLEKMTRMSKPKRAKKLMPRLPNSKRHERQSNWFERRNASSRLRKPRWNWLPYAVKKSLAERRRTSAATSTSTTTSRFPTRMPSRVKSSNQDTSRVK